MPDKPKQRNWNDVQLAIISIALVFSLILWNNFAGPDRVRAQNNSVLAAATATTDQNVAMVPTLLPEIKIIFGGSAPGSTSGPAAFVPPARRPRSGGGGGGGGGGTGGS